MVVQAKRRKRSYVDYYCYSTSMSTINSETRVRVTPADWGELLLPVLPLKDLLLFYHDEFSSSVLIFGQT